MATVAQPEEKATELLQNLSLEATKEKNSDAPDATKKPPAQHGSVGSEVASIQVPPYDRSLTPIIPDYMDPTLCYVPNGYAHQAYYYGGYDGSMNEWDHAFSRYVGPEGVDMSHGVYGDAYHHGYGFPPYGAYPTASLVPTVGHDGHLYGPHQYQFPASYYQPPTSSSFTPTEPPTSCGDITPTVTSDQPPVVDTTKANLNAKTGRNEAKWIPRLGSPGPWMDQAAFPDWQHRPNITSTVSTATSHACNLSPARNQNRQPLPNFLGVPPSGMGSVVPGFLNRMYQDRGLYGQCGNAFRSTQGFVPNGYDSRMNGRSWVTMDKFRARLRGNVFYSYGIENMEGLNELNRGPRSDHLKNNQKILGPNIVLAVKGHTFPTIANNDDAGLVPDRDQYNRMNFPDKYTDAKFYVIKSYSEDDIHKSVKYSVWASTPIGNKKLDAGYKEAKEKSGGCPVFLFFSVNTSGQFVGVAEMVGPVDFNKTVDYWQQDKWNGCFPLKWHIVKDVPNNILKHITLENNDNKPVTNSRDTQEVMFVKGIQLLKLFKDHVSKTSILDDFVFYETRQKAMQEKRAKQQFQKQVYGTAAALEKDGAPAKLKLSKPLEVTFILNKGTDEGKLSDKNEVVKVSSEAPNVAKAVPEISILANGVANVV